MLYIVEKLIKWTFWKYKYLLGWNENLSIVYDISCNGHDEECNNLNENSYYNNRIFRDVYGDILCWSNLLAYSSNEKVVAMYPLFGVHNGEWKFKER